MKFCFVDRLGAHAIWGIINPVASALTAAGHEVDYVRMDDGHGRGEFPAPEKINLIDIPVSKKTSFIGLLRQQSQFFQQYTIYLAEKRPDIVHVNFAVPGVVARYAASRHGVSCIVSTQHELYGSMYFHYRWALRLTERYCSAIVYVSKTVASSFGRKLLNLNVDNFGDLPMHIVIPNGVDIVNISAAIADVGNRVQNQIVCVGRMVPVKGQLLLIEALPEVVCHHQNLKLRLIGSGSMESELRKRVRELGLTAHVDFLGWQPHDVVLHELASAELVVVPSDEEGFGLVVAEALVCGAPLLVSDISVFREIINRFSGRGEFFAKGDRRSLVEKLNIMLSKNASATILSNAISDEELVSLSSEAMTEAYLCLYKNLDGGK